MAMSINIRPAFAFSWTTIVNGPDVIFQYAPDTVEYMGGKVVAVTNESGTKGMPDPIHGGRLPSINIRAKVVIDCKEMTYKEVSVTALDPVNPGMMMAKAPKQGDIIGDPGYKALYSILCQKGENSTRNESYQQTVNPEDDPMAKQLYQISERTYNSCNMNDVKSIENMLSPTVTMVSDRGGIIDYKWNDSTWEQALEFKKKLMLKLLISMTHCKYGGTEKRINLYKDSNLVAYADKEANVIKILR
jgi:hypothetical protein